jgi:hypothetical protein
MKNRHPYLAFLAAAAVGATLWLVSAKISGRREPWDSAFYWKVSYPIAIVLSGVLGYAVPERPWRWSLAVMLSQFAAMAIKDDLGGLWPLGLVLFGALAIPGMGVAFFAARLRTGRDKG